MSTDALNVVALQNCTSSRSANNQLHRACCSTSVWHREDLHKGCSKVFALQCLQTANLQRKQTSYSHLWRSDVCTTPSAKNVMPPGATHVRRVLSRAWLASVTHALSGFQAERYVRAFCRWLLARLEQAPALHTWLCRWRNCSALIVATGGVSSSSASSAWV
jgi:hypothetical protein